LVRAFIDHHIHAPMLYREIYSLFLFYFIEILLMHELNMVTFQNHLKDFHGHATILYDNTLY